MLIPKTDEDLKTWKEKLANGIKYGTHKYIVKSTFTVAGDLDTIASSIEKKSNEALASKHTVKKADISALLAEGKTYPAGTLFDFPKYKKGEENLWLKAECQGDIKKHAGEFLKREGEYLVIGQDKCECEARIRAFLRMLRVGEGTGELVKSYDYNKKETIYISHDFEKGYTTAFGGNNITDLSDHPRIDYGDSTAAGAYQVLEKTWDDVQFANKRGEYKVNSFSKENQDKFSVLLMKHHPGCSDLLSILLSGQTEKSIRGIASRIWASLPEKGDNSRYSFRGQPQPVTPMKTVLEHFNKFLKEELAGNSPLHLKKGFLKDFGIKCNCGDDSADSSDWHHPLDRMELRGWYGSGFYPGDSDHGDAEVRISGHHDGLDLYAPLDTTVYACVDGEIYDDYVSGTYGNTIGIKGTYNGETYYFFYAHLSERIVVKDDKVSAGDVIGKTGQSGNARGQAAKMNHLHFEVRNTSARTGGKLNPLATIDELNRDVITNPDQNTQTGR